MIFASTGARSAAVDDLLRGTMPDELRETAVAARQVLQGTFTQRFQFAITYRIRRDLPP